MATINSLGSLVQQIGVKHEFLVPLLCQGSVTPEILQHIYGLFYLHYEGPKSQNVE